MCRRRVHTSSWKMERTKIKQNKTFNKNCCCCCCSVFVWLFILFHISCAACAAGSVMRQVRASVWMVTKPTQQERSSRMGWPSEKGTFFFICIKGRRRRRWGKKEREARITSAHAGQTRGIGRAKGRDCLSVVSGIYRIVDRFLLFLSLSLFTVVVVASVFFSREKKTI